MIKFIKVKKDDIQELAKLAHDIWFEFWPAILILGQIYYMVNHFQSEVAIKDQMEREHYYYYFINVDGENVGYFGFNQKKDFLFLSKLYLKKEFRGKGLGKLAMERIIKVAKSNKLKKIQLTVNKFNTKTIKAYEKWGFTIVASVVTDIGEGYVMDDHIMEYEIKQEA